MYIKPLRLQQFPSGTGKGFDTILLCCWLGDFLQQDDLCDKVDACWNWNILWGMWPTWFPPKGFSFCIWFCWAVLGSWQPAAHGSAVVDDWAHEQVLQVPQPAPRLDPASCCKKRCEVWMVYDGYLKAVSPVLEMSRGNSLIIYWPLPTPMMPKEGFGALASLCQARSWPLYKLKPKLHMQMHLQTLGYASTAPGFLAS